MLDILPTKVQWDLFANPAVVTGYFHWPMLANVDLATTIISAQGGGVWARSANERISGPSAQGKSRVAADGALDVYGELFDSEETIRWTCEDYRAGAFEDVDEQKKDQEAGRKIAVPTLVMFSAARLGKTADVAGVWRRDWVKEGVDFKGLAVGDECGHYLPEEAHEVVGREVRGFLGRVVKG